MRVLSFAAASLSMWLGWSCLFLATTEMAHVVNAYGYGYASSSSVSHFRTVRSTLSMRKGRPSLKKTVKGSTGGAGAGLSSNESMKGSPGTSSSPGSSGSSNWFPVSGMTSVGDLPTSERNKVVLVETKVRALQDVRTNPNGAVSVVTTDDGRTFCVGSSCPSCKIPLTKAQILGPNDQSEDETDPRLSCDFCSATYNLRTGEKLPDAGPSKGLLGGLVKGLMGAQPTTPLPVYQLGEKNGKVLIKLNS